MTFGRKVLRCSPRAWDWVASPVLGWHTNNIVCWRVASDEQLPVDGRPHHQAFIDSITSGRRLLASVVGEVFYDGTDATVDISSVVESEIGAVLVNERLMPLFDGFEMVIVDVAAAVKLHGHDHVSPIVAGVRDGEVAFFLAPVAWP